MLNLRRKNIKGNDQAQTAIEYILLLAVVVAIVLVAFKADLPRIFNAANVYQNRVFEGVAGPSPRCGNNEMDYGSEGQPSDPCPLM
jgi:Flp pilus assembly pilin Flp